MKANADKCYLITSKNENIVVNEENNPIKNSRYEKLLGVKIDHELTFNSHITKICKETGQKMNTLCRIVPYINTEIQRTLLNIFFTSQFKHSPLMWICCSRASSNKIHCLHESCLRVICNDKICFIKQLMEKESFAFIHTRTIHFIAVEIFVVVTKTLSDLYLLKKQNSYNL